MSIPSWDDLFMKQVYLISSKSKDTRTQIGAVLVRENRVISQGYNGFPMGVNDDISARHERPLKYSYVVHAEENCVITCARFGISSLGSTCYTNGVPCEHCCKVLINGGVKEVVVHGEWEEWERKLYHDKWLESAKVSRIMFEEAGVNLRVLNTHLGTPTLLDGKIITV